MCLLLIYSIVCSINWLCQDNISDIDPEEIPLTPTIVEVGVKPMVIYYVYFERENIGNEGEATFLDVLKVAYALYFILNIRYSKDLSTTLEFLQNMFLKIHPDLGSKSEKVSAVRKKDSCEYLRLILDALAFGKKIHFVNLQQTYSKSIWAYGIQQWGCAPENSIQIIERFQNNVLKNAIDAGRYFRNRDQEMNIVSQTISNVTRNYEDRFLHHVNVEAIWILENPNQIRKLTRTLPYELMKWKEYLQLRIR
ncbi:hypothetical protein JTB14_005282 [Gonioctena quinquepunctata]|nr:hypothetical protein JTB14_005282 [Gonioctena quinquepunctata]